jgi:hypothetical protein
MSEPTQLIVGDTWTWDKSLADYPANAAPAWILTYYFRSRTGEFTTQAAPSGADHAVLVAKAVSATYRPDFYEWSAVVDNGIQRHVVGTGHLTVKPDPTKIGAGFDPRTHARKTLEALEAVIEGKATHDQLESTVGGIALRRMTWEDLLMAREKYVSLVAAEDAGVNLASERRVPITFNRI